ncbi:MAG TPA: carbohydrate kinase family protein [Terracidiphilus sp.]|nr:carbohydrate kinase family protein [Terracidiphilus sp.]
MAIRDDMKKYDLVVVGEIYVDHVLTGFSRWPQPGEEVYAQDYVLELGGGAANTACALGRLGRSVSLIGTIGEAEAPWVHERLSNFGVSDDELRRVGGRTGITVSVSGRMDRSFFTYLGANTNLEEHLNDDALVERMTQARHIHFAMPIKAPLAKKLLAELTRKGCSTSLDVGHHAEWLQDAANLQTCASIDYLLPNEREARIICQGGAEDYLNFTSEQGWPSGVVKMGAGGAIMRSDSGTLRALPPNVDTIDTTGAGDAFNAGFIDALLDRRDPAECLRRGCVVGGLSTRSAGALRALPTRDELETCLEECYG